MCKQKDVNIYVCLYIHNFLISVLTFVFTDIINLKEVQDIESTVLYHVYQAAQLNHENMKDFIRFLKHVSHASEYMLQPFMLSVLMSVSGIYEDQVYQIFSICIIKSNTYNTYNV